MNRAMRRQGQKNLRKQQLAIKRDAERKGIAVPPMPRASMQPSIPPPPPVVDHENRNKARARGLLVPPSPEEKQALERRGHSVPSGTGLWTPPR